MDHAFAVRAPSTQKGWLAPVTFGVILLTAGCAVPQGEADWTALRTQYPLTFREYHSSPMPTPDPELLPVQYQIKVDDSVALDEEPPAPQETEPVAESSPEDVAGCPAYPIDLPTALRLAGGNNLQIALALERLREAEARWQGAQALWLPSINAGVGYNAHTGQIQDTSGQVLDVDRESVFVGGGPNLGAAPLTGGTNGPARLFLGLPLADAIFGELSARQEVAARDARAAETFQETVLNVALAYQDLVEGYQQVSVARQAVAEAEELHRLVSSRVEAGTVPPADGLRAEAELADQQLRLQQAEEQHLVSSAELVRLLRLDPLLTLSPVETEPTPVVLVELTRPLPDLLAQGLTVRPELTAHQALVQATLERMRQEHWRPWIPHVQLGLSAGGFGGGTDIRNFGGRTDFDALLVWELRSLGFGNRALRRERTSQHLQAQLSAEQARDNVAAEIARAYHQVQTRSRQMEAATERFRAAAEALPLNFKGIVGGQLRAIEAQQAVQALATARREYVTAVVRFNQAQFLLARAIGDPADGSPEVCPTCHGTGHR